MQFEVWLFGVVHFFLSRADCSEWEEWFTATCSSAGFYAVLSILQHNMHNVLCLSCSLFNFFPRFCKHLNMPTYFVLLLPVQTWKRRLLLTNLSKTCYFFVRLYVCEVLPMSNGALFSALQMLFCIVHCSLYKRMMSLFLQHAFCSPIEHVFTHSSYPPALSVLLFT